MKTKYTTSNTVGLFFLLIGTFGWVISVWNSPSGFQIDSVVLILIASTIFIFFDLLWGINVSLSKEKLSRIDSFVFRKEIPLDDIQIIRYQPTYGIGKEASSLYIFRKEHTVASITMTSLWFTERVLRDFLRDIKKLNPAISLDEEARQLMEKTDDYFDTQKIQVVPFLLGIVGVVGGILLFIKAQSTITEEFNLVSHGMASVSAGLIAGFGTYTLLRRSWIGFLIGFASALLLLGVYWIATN